MQIPQSQRWERTPKPLDRKSNQKENRKEPNQELKFTSNTQIVKFQIPPIYIKKNIRIPFTDSNQTNKKSQTKILLWAPDTIFLETPNKQSSEKLHQNPERSLSLSLSHSHSHSLLWVFVVLQAFGVYPPRKKQREEMHELYERD